MLQINGDVKGEKKLGQPGEESEIQITLAATRIHRERKKEEETGRGGGKEENMEEKKKEGK